MNFQDLNFDHVEPLQGERRDKLEPLLSLIGVVDWLC
jgi:hypothetical protein